MRISDWSSDVCSSDLSSAGDEVDQLLDPAEQRRIEVLEPAHPTEDVLPGTRDVGLVAVRPAQLLADAVLPLDVARDVRPPLDAEPRGLDRCPDGDERMNADQHGLDDGWVRDRAGDPALLGPLYPVGAEPPHREW